MKNRMVFWRANGCYASALAILEELEPAFEKMGKSIFIRKLEGSLYKPAKDDYIINWGNGGFNSFPELKGNGVGIHNHPDSVNIAANKIKTFKAMDADKVQTLKWTTDRKQAQKWYDDDEVVIGRKVVSGCCGEGIEIYEKAKATGVDTCPLYTLYQKKKDEYRVHVFNGKVIDVVQKRKKKGIDNKTEGKIRNVDDGWVFCHEDVNPPAEILTESVKAVAACGLKFGAVDIVWNQKLDKVFVIEVNTAPGLESSTIKAYAKAFLEDFQNA